MRTGSNASLSLALAIALAAWTALTAVVGARPADQLVPRPTPPPDKLCSGSLSQARSPDVILLGETVAVTLVLKATCIQVPRSLHVVMVADPSATMSSRDVESMRDAMVKLVDKFHANETVSAYVGVVAVDETDRVLSLLARDRNAVKTAIAKIRVSGMRGDSRTAAGIRRAMRMLMVAREEMQLGSQSINEVLILFSDGNEAQGCGQLLREARNAKTQGIIVISVCVGARCDQACLRSAATSTRYYFPSPQDGLLQIFERIRTDARFPVIKRIETTETLAAGIDYVSDSAVPQPIGVGPERTLSWLENYVPDEGLTMTYRVMPREIGERAISQGASAWLVGNNNARFQVVAPTPPPVLVLQPFPAAPTRAPRP